MKNKLIRLLAITILAVGVLTACSSEDKSITVLSANYTESKLFGHLHEQLIEEATDIEVELKTDLPATSVIIESMNQGEGDLAMMYTGEITNGYFEIDNSSYAPEHFLSEAQRGFDETYNFKWYDSLGFQNQYAFAVRKDYAEEHGLETLSDLNKVADEAVVRVETQWLERADDGYDAFANTYEYDFGNVKPMEVSLIYKAIDNEEVDVGLVYTTDPRISTYDLKVLEDDRQFFPPYLASSVVRNETLEEYPEIADVLDKMVDQFDEETMRELNGAVSVDNKSPEEAVQEFLEENNYLK